MHRALALGETVRGRTSPNPPVGAVVLGPDGTLVGEGATAPAGGPHAEIVALGRGRRAGPRRHRRRHPRAVRAHRPHRPVRRGADRRRRRPRRLRRRRPEPGGRRRRGRGCARPASRSSPGVEPDEAAAGALRPWLHAVRTGRPFVTWKYAATLDGRVAAADGTARWITGRASRADVHALRGDRRRDRGRQRHRARRRPAAHRPRRRRRRRAERQPLRVVLDRRHRVAADARACSTTRAETLVLDTAVPRFALKALFDRGVRHVLLEGGPTLAGAFLEARLRRRGRRLPRAEAARRRARALGDAGHRIDRPRRVTLDVDDGRPARAATCKVVAPTRHLGRTGRRRSRVFTGIIEEVGEVVGRRARAATPPCCTIARARVADDVAHGASIAVNGVCLTVVGWRSTTADAGELDFDVMGETLKRSGARRARRRATGSTSSAPSAPTRASDGHIVQGHVDGTGVVRRRARPATRWEAVRFGAAGRARPLRRREGLDRRRRRLADRDARSATTGSRSASSPRPCARPRWARKRPGDPVNLEVDVLAKYVERLLEAARMSEPVIRLDTHRDGRSPTSRPARPSS